MDGYVINSYIHSYPYVYPFLSLYISILILTYIHSYPYIYPFLSLMYIYLLSLHISILKFFAYMTFCTKAKPFFVPGNILPLSLRESDGTYQMTSSGDNQWLPLAPGQIHLSHPVESISFFKFEIPWDSSLHNSKHLDR